MAKLDLKTLLSGLFSTTTLNDNFEDLENEFQDKILYRENPQGEPNDMKNDLDMGSNSVINAGTIDAKGITINGQDLLVGDPLNAVPLPSQAGQTGKFLQSTGVLGLEQWEHEDAATVTYTGTLTSTNVKDAIEEVDAKTGGGVSLDTVNAWTKQQYIAESTRTATEIALEWDLDIHPSITVTLDNSVATNIPAPKVGTQQDGGIYTMIVIGAADGSGSLTWDASYKWQGGVPFVKTAGSGAVDIISFYSSGGNMYALPTADFQ